MDDDGFERFSEYLVSTLNLVSLTRSGLHGVLTKPEILRVLGPQANEKVDSAKLLEQETRLATADREAALAKLEIDSDFALLNGHALIGVWGALEAFVEDLAAHWLATHVQALDEDVFRKIKVNVAVWEKLAPADRHKHLVVEVQREVRADLSQGVGQFEGLLKAIGLGGGVDDEMRRPLFVGQQMRHLIAHRGSIADARFVQACPDLGYSVGDPVRVSSKDLLSVMDAATLYSRLLRNRRRSRLGDPQVLTGVPDERHHLITAH